MRPTREELDAARDVLDQWGSIVTTFAETESAVDAATADRLREAIRTILADAEPATDLEIVAHARERYSRTASTGKERAAFLAGVRWRERR